MTNAMTPGPWHVKEDREHHACNSRVMCAAGYVVATAYHSPTAHRKYSELWAEAEANAQAIAALPELVEVARSVASTGLHPWPDGECSCSRCEGVREARAALAKAGL